MFGKLFNKRNIIALIVLSIVGIFAGTVAANAAYVQEHSATRLVQPLRVTDSEPLYGGRLRAYFNNGAVYRFGVCEYEDSPNCFWDAGTSGNGAGRSFVDLNGTAYYIDGNYPYSF